jgi:hypothetical protein
VKHRVAVQGQSIVIDVRQKSGSVWTATGDYLGQTITVEARMASSIGKIGEVAAATSQDS